METWSVWSLDVWGNAKDGYEVNDRGRVGRIELAEKATYSQVTKALVDGGFLKPRFKFNFDGDDMNIWIERKGRPLLQLELDYDQPEPGEDPRDTRRNPGHNYLTQTEVRDYFWDAHPEFHHERRTKKRQNDYRADIRMAFIDMVDMLARDGAISEKLANKVTL